MVAPDKALGWRTRLVVSGCNENDTFRLITALDSALATKPVAVVMTATLPESGWKSVLPQYAATGVALVPMCSGPLSTPT